MSHIATITVTATRSGSPSALVINRGPVGPMGASAYEQAVAAGYEGTLEEWVDSSEGARLGAVAAADAAFASAESAADFASSAESFAADAESSASNAADLASEASVSSADAGDFAAAASASADAAALSETNAGLSAASAASAAASVITGASTKTTPIDADSVAIVDSAAGSVVKRTLWSDIKATLKTYFDSLYAAASHVHSAATTSVAGFMSTSDKTKLDAITGTNTGDQDLSAYATKDGSETLTNKTLVAPAIGDATGTSIALSSGTLTTSTPSTLSQVWNAAGVAFSALRINATNTASATTSSLTDWRLDGASVARIRRDGAMEFGPASENTRIFRSQAFYLTCNVNNNTIWQIDSSNNFCFNGGLCLTGARDAVLYRIAAGVVGVGTTTGGNVGGTVHAKTFSGGGTNNSVNLLATGTGIVDIGGGASIRLLNTGASAISAGLVFAKDEYGNATVTITNSQSTAIAGSGLIMPSDRRISWSDNAGTGGGSRDVCISRVSANVLGVGIDTSGSTTGSIALTNLTASGFVKAGSFTVATVPSASTSGAGAMIYVSNESGGATIAFSDGTNWRRVNDRSIIS
jgi:hypothetical protein